MKPCDLFKALVLVYFLAAVLGKILYSRFLGRIETLPLLYALTFIALLFLGFRQEVKVPGWAFLVAGSLLLITLGWGYTLGGIVSLLLLKYLIERNALEKGVMPAIAVSVGLVLTASALGGVPLFNPGLRFSWVRYPYLAAGYIMVGAIAVRPSPLLLALGEGMAVAGTSRTIGVGVAVAYLIRTLYNRRGSVPTSKKALPLVVALLIVVFLARYSATLRDYPVWNLGFLGSVLYRPASSYTVYERLFEMGMPLGHYKLLFMTNPTYYVGELFGKKIGYTYTLFGEPAYDFGIPGILEALIIGTVLRKASKNPFTGTFALTVGTLTLDIGIEGSFLTTFFYLAYLSSLGDENER